MEFEKIVHENVKRDGTFEDKLGAVETDGGIRIGRGCGCGSPGCHCSDGYFISIFSPRDSWGKVEGVIVRFDSQKEMDRYL